MREADILAQAKAAFMEEARDLLDQLEASLLALAEKPDADVVNAAFRAAHTIKGSSGLFGLERVVTFTHGVETLLEKLRSRELEVTDATVTLLLECRDQIERLLDEVEGSEAAEDHASESARLAALLHRAIEGGAGGPADPAPSESLPSEPVPAGAPPSMDADPAIAAPGGDRAADHDDWIVQARFGADTFTAGFDPLSFLRYLPTVGEVLAAESRLDDVPPLDELDAERCHLGVVLRLRSAATKREIEAVFDFVADSIELQMLPPTRRIEEMRQLLEQHEDDRTRLGDLLVRIGALTPRELALALDRQQQGPVPDPVEGARPARRLGELLSPELAPPEVVQAAVERQSQLRQKKSEESRFVRVQADKLDALVSLIGELVIAGSASQILAGRSDDVALAEAAARVCSLVEGARDRALQLRMVPIGETLSRFKRVAHEVSRQLGKEVDLTITGGDAELDKSMVDQIIDPLTHLVRNALDHGLEPPAERERAGKPARGRLVLAARHESGSIVIEVSDDGRGLSRERILAKAVERGLVAPDAQLSDPQVYQLIFLPGFSTAEQVTGLSGRGVGMDVVRRNIEDLRGEVSLASTPGRGSTVQIRLPLTLAIIDGFRFEVAGQTFVVPLDAVVECIETPAEAAALAAGTSCFHLRGEMLPLMCLRHRLGLHGEPPPQRSVLVMRCGARKVGVLVDRLLGEHQTVIKPLGRLLRRLRGISGSTILGTGSVALILDIPALAATAATEPSTTVPHPPIAGRSPSHRPSPAATVVT